MLKTQAPPWNLAPSIATVWQQDAAALFALSRATHALTLVAALFAARGVARPRAWFPAYFCENGLPPLRQSGAFIRFYPVTEAMTPDWDACRAMMADGPPDLFVLPHFFGVENEATEARAFCDETGALLLEDAAHLLRPAGGIGRTGDLVCYSPRKYLDLPDAGILVARSAALAGEIAAASRTLQHTPLSITPWMRERLRRTLFPRRRRSPMPVRRIDDDVPDIPLLPAIWISPTSRGRLAHLGPPGVDAVAAGEARIVAQFDTVASRVGLALLPRDPDATPYLVGYRAATSSDAERILSALRDAGAMVHTWPGLPPEVKAEPGRYGAAMSIRRTLLRFTPRTASDRRPLDFLAKLPKADA